MKNFTIIVLYGILIIHYMCKIALAVIKKRMGEIMLNQERVCEMTKLAIFDQKEGRECKPMIQYFRKDYPDARGRAKPGTGMPGRDV